MTAETASTLPRASSWWRLSPPDAASLILALTLAVPLASVISSLLTGQSPVFVHLPQALLGESVLNALSLGLLVIIGVLIIGVPAAWLVACCESPGRRVLGAALVLPLAAPAYGLAYAYADFLSAFGPVQSTLRAATGWETGDYFFPDIRSLPGAALMLTLTLYPYVYLLVRARFLGESSSAREAALLLVQSGGPTRDFGRHLMHSLTLAVSAGAIVTLGALVLAVARKFRPNAIAGRAASFAAMGYAVPGSVIAVGVLTPFAYFDNLISGAAKELFGVSTGLLLTGGIAALLFAYTALYLAVALQSVGAGLERITPSIGGAARLLGQGPWDEMKRVYLPL